MNDQSGTAGALRSLRTRFFQGLQAVIFVMVLLLLVIVFSQVFTRYVAHISINWFEEAARMLLVWLTMLGACVAAERKEHYVVSVVVDRLSPRIRLPILLLTNALAIVFLACLAIYGWEFFKSGFSRYYVSLNIPQAFVFISMPAGAVIMMFSIVSHSIEAWLGRERSPAQAASLGAVHAE